MRAGTLGFFVFSGHAMALDTRSAIIGALFGSLATAAAGFAYLDRHEPPTLIDFDRPMQAEPESIYRAADALDRKSVV